MKKSNMILTEDEQEHIDTLTEQGAIPKFSTKVRLSVMIDLMDKGLVELKNILPIMYFGY
jgi:hypothetical protein